MADKAPTVFGDTIVAITQATSPFIFNLAEVQEHPIGGFIIINTGRASFTVQESVDGNSFGDALTVLPNDVYKMNSRTEQTNAPFVDRVQITRGTADSSFKLIGSGGEVDYYTDSRIRIKSVAPTTITLNSTTTTKILDANPDRLDYTVSNDNGQSVWVKEQAASVDNLKEGVIVFGRSVGVFDGPCIYTGEVSAIAVNGSPTIKVVER